MKPNDVLEAKRVFIENAETRIMVIPRRWGAQAVADCGPDSPEARELAALFAAAPAMLNALKWAEACLRNPGPHMDQQASLEAVQRAILLATKSF